MYHPIGGRMLFLPAGMDQLFSNPQLTWRPHMAGRVASAVMETAEGREAYAATFRHLFVTEFSSVQISNEIQRVLRSLRAELSRGSFTQMQEAAADLCLRISQREQFLKTELAKPEPAVLEIPGTGLRLADADWTPVDRPAHGKMAEDLTADRKVALHIVAGPRTAGSWRTTLRLRRGQYRFEALVQVQDLVPLPFGKNQGAAVRVAGMAQEGPRLVGPSSGWAPLRADFAVETAEAEVELVCELRANGGEAWFAKESLVVTSVK